MLLALVHKNNIYTEEIMNECKETKNKSVIFIMTVISYDLFNSYLEILNKTLTLTILQWITVYFHAECISIRVHCCKRYGIR